MKKLKRKNNLVEDFAEYVKQCEEQAKFEARKKISKDVGIYPYMKKKPLRNDLYASEQKGPVIHFNTDPSQISDRYDTLKDNWVPIIAFILLIGIVMFGFYINSLEPRIETVVKEREIQINHTVYETEIIEKTIEVPVEEPMGNFTGKLECFRGYCYAE